MQRVATTLVGIVNLTPDSFSDGGKFTSAKIAIDHALQLVKEGAGVLDIGAESTRPGASPLSWQEEWARLEPFLEELLRHPKSYLLSLDTRHPEVVRRALDYHIDWINDVSGIANPEMATVLAPLPHKIVLMHSLSIPADRSKTLPMSADPVDELISWAWQKISDFEKRGIHRERLIFDPGIGFGKTAEQSLGLLQRIKEFKKLGLPILVGHSRKSFLALFTDKPAEQRDRETMVISYYLAGQGIEYLRVHDVAINAAALKLAKVL